MHVFDSVTNKTSFLGNTTDTFFRISSLLVGHNYTFSVQARCLLNGQLCGEPAVLLYNQLIGTAHTHLLNIKAVLLPFTPFPGVAPLKNESKETLNTESDSLELLEALTSFLAFSIEFDALSLFLIKSLQGSNELKLSTNVSLSCFVGASRLQILNPGLLEAQRNLTVFQGLQTLHFFLQMLCSLLHRDQRCIPQ